MARDPPRAGGGLSRWLPTLLLAALCLLAAAPAAYAFVAPALGGTYVLVQETFNDYSGRHDDGSFTTATWGTMAGDVQNAASGGSGVVWDARNNSIAYLLDYNVIRVLDFSNPTSATAVTR